MLNNIFIPFLPYVSTPTQQSCQKTYALLRLSDRVLVAVFCGISVVWIEKFESTIESSQENKQIPGIIITLDSYDERQKCHILCWNFGVHVYSDLKSNMR